MLEALLPYINSALRQIEHLPEQQPTPVKVEPEPKDESLNILSCRELEIMDWVTKGKTNQEIGMILDISAFTVKNHLQHILKKLNVLNQKTQCAESRTGRRQVPQIAVPSITARTKKAVISTSSPPLDCHLPLG